LGSVVSECRFPASQHLPCPKRFHGTFLKNTADPEAGALWVRIGYQRGARLFEQDPVHFRLENIGN
jgi:hypothetical protein